MGNEGSNYHGPNSDCYHCNGCGTYRPCDDCSANCCQNNMYSHRELRRYEDNFANEVSNLIPITLNGCNSIIRNLRECHDIDININHENKFFLFFFFRINQCNFILDKMREKKQSIKNEILSIKIDNSFEIKINNLKNQHSIKMKKIKEKFNKKKEKIKNDSEINKLNIIINEKKEKKNKLNDEKNNIDDYQQTEIDNFRNQSDKRLNILFEDKKRKIDLKYRDIENIKEPIIEYTIEEKKEKNDLLYTIRQIQNYKNHPMCKSFIEKIKLEEYLYNN